MSSCALAIGNFDGVHIGHQALLRQVVEFAREKKLLPSALTFYPHPTAIVAPHRKPSLLVDIEERVRLVKNLGIENVVVLPFTTEVARMTPEEFVRQILLESLTTRAVFVGENFHFGARQAGTPRILRALSEEFGFESFFLPPVCCRGEIVSSSAIRNHIAHNRLGRANRLLGRCFAMRGDVVSGHGIGSKQTVPTLNLKHNPEQTLPHGVFVTETTDLDDGRHWKSITNAGTRPTFEGDAFTVETFLLEPLEDPAPKKIRVDFHRFIRPERHFPSPAELRAQIFADVGRADAYWKRITRLKSLHP